MGSGHITLGELLLALIAASLGVKYLRALKQGSFRWWGWAGLAIIIGSEFFLFCHVGWVATFFTPVVWTGYLLLIDALVSSLRGRSRLGSEPGKFLALPFWSVPLWLIFEAYNLRLANWTYIGLPESLVLRALGYLWSFATIWPAIFETADFIQALGLFRQQATRRITFSPSSHFIMLIVGLLLVTVPVLIPVRTGQYLFGGVWLGFVFLLDPLNYRWNGRSLLRDLETGQIATFFSFMVAGLVCGVFWEFWNYWAGAKWIYVFPIGHGWKLFQMPLPGYLGFPPFALECFVMYEFLRSVRNQLAGLDESRNRRRQGRDLEEMAPRASHDSGLNQWS